MLFWGLLYLFKLALGADLPQLISSKNYSDLLANLHHGDECVKESLHHILPTCIESGPEFVSSSLRRLVSVKLAVCEFENSNILYPSSCYNLPANLDLCILDLEKSPQFWTSFSGYYRDIESICFQASIPYQKDHIIQLYSNISSIHEQMLQEFYEFHNFSHNSYHDLQSKLLELFSFINDSMKQSQASQASSEEKFSEFNSHLHTMLQTSLDSILFANNDIFESFHEIANQITYYSQVFESLTTVVHDAHLVETTTELQNSILNRYSQLDSASNELLSQILMKMEGIDIITVTTERGLEKLNKNIFETDNLSREISNSLVSSHLSLQNQLDMIMHFNSKFESFTDTIESKMNHLFEETTSNIYLFVNNTFSNIEQRLNKTEIQIDSINNNLHILANLSDRFRAFTHGTLQRIKTFPIVRLSSKAYIYACNLVSTAFSTSLNILLVFEVLVFAAICVLMFVVGNKIIAWKRFLFSLDLTPKVIHLRMVVSILLGIACALSFKHFLDPLQP